MPASIFEKIRKNRKRLLQLRHHGKWLKERTAVMYVAIRKRNIELKIRKLMILRLYGMMEAQNSAETDSYLQKSKS